MAYSTANISAADLAYLAADKPILGSQAIPAAPTACIWHNSGSTTDRTSATYPARRAYDGFGGLVTKPTTASEDKVWYYSMDLAAAGVEFDFVAILGHNFGTLHGGGALTVTLEVDDASNFATCVSIPITTTTGTGNTRIVALVLDHVAATAKRYSAVRYARLKITRGATNFTPEIGELVLGRRLQMYHKPDVPYDTYSLHGNKEVSITQGGVVHSSVFSKGRRQLSASWRNDSTTLQAAISAWVTATSYKTRPFVWIENPYSAPASWHLMVPDDADFNMPLEEQPAIRTFELEATEQGPESHYLNTGTY